MLIKKEVPEKDPQRIRDTEGLLELYDAARVQVQASLSP